MLELKNITKEYPSGDGKVQALKGINLKFRRSEFVSILGPSGCGKTTMLNIIGGLDQYTEGDLVINGTSTKEYKDRDWDSYRNHSIGFVFQTYNLIPHQTVLANVELALTLSGVSKQERKERAKKALEEVGLGNQLNKKPNQMSGGQMQRVAIARALVNDPDIILADEPTGALDTETSLQVMEILKKVSSKRLVIMVTHNPDLAYKYSTRIINILDGVITNDSKPLTDFEATWEMVRDKKDKAKLSGLKKPTMKFSTAFKLSLKNLFTKKGRTILTSFAGSIGIIGIALILSVSQGMTGYIDRVQEETLSSYPIMIESSSVDLSSIMTAFMGEEDEDSSHELDKVYTKSAIYDMVNALSNIETSENDLKSFKKYIEKELEEEEFNAALSGVQYSYQISPVIYTKNVDGEIIKSDAEQLLMELVSENMSLDMTTMDNLMNMSPMMSSSSSAYSVWQQLLPAKDGKPINPLLDKQYDMVYGRWPEKFDEVVLIVDSNNELDDMTLYALGLVSRDDIDEIMDASMTGQSVEKKNKSWSYEEIAAQEYRVVLDSACFTIGEDGLYTDLRDTDTGLKYLYDNATPIRVTGIVRPNEDATVSMLSASIGYTNLLTEHVIKAAETADALKAQKDSPEKDIFTGLPFKSNTGKLTNQEKKDEFTKYLDSMNAAEKVKTYISMKSLVPLDMLKEQTDNALKNFNREMVEKQISMSISSEMALSEDEIADYLAKLTDDELKDMMRPAIEDQIKMQYAQSVTAQMSRVPAQQLVMMLEQELKDAKLEDMGRYYDELMEFSKSTYDENLLTLGYVDLETPYTINLYAASFENKDMVEEAIAKYNDGKDELEQIKYTDYVGLIMSSVTTIINAITYVLIAFVAISLIVSSIMIGVITLISVQERTKEIGILRAIGASKKDVSSMFNAETLIIGFTSGLLGVLVTYLLLIPINAILHSLTGIPSLSAYFAPEAAVILVVISMLLTLFAGIIPSRSAAKKDPVVALRTE